MGFADSLIRCDKNSFLDFKLGNFDMTIADCEQCLRLEPNNVKALQRKAQALLNQSKYREVSIILNKEELRSGNISHFRHTMIVPKYYRLNRTMNGRKIG